VRQADSPVTHDPRVNHLLAQMTRAEKFRLLSGRAEPVSARDEYQAGYLAGVPRLRIPALTLADGPPGVVVRRASTGMTATMGVAATFDPAAARGNGRVIGRDARALGQDVVLEPFVNLDRDTSWRRGFDTFGEDPLLTADMAAATVTGIQSRDVMAQAKHLLGFDGAANVVMDAQTLHEVYLAPFAAAVHAGVASVMCSYAVVDGTYSCGNARLLQRVLRGQLHFRGFVTSDWGANHATSYLADGLDMEMPGTSGPANAGIPRYFDPSSLRAALRDGTITERMVDTAVGRILVQYDRFGLLDRSWRPPSALPVARDERVVLRTGERAATLLRDRRHALPLSRAALRSLAVIGPGAGQVIATDGEGEHSSGLLAQQVSPLAALRAEAPHAHVRYAVGDDLTGVPVPPAALSHDGSPGLVRTSKGRQQVDPAIDFTVAGHSSLPAVPVSWTGTLTVPRAGRYSLDMQTLGAVSTLVVDGHQVVSTGGGYGGAPRYGVVHPGGGTTPVPTTDGLADGRAVLTLSAGRHALTVTSAPDVSGRPVQVRLNWVPPWRARRVRAAAVAAARRAHTAVVFAWADGDDDLSHPLPDGQDALIDAVARANPDTVVVLNTSQPVAMPWLGKVRALLQMWYPGDRGGIATARTLLGSNDPAGHLPVTWPRRIGQELAHQAAHPERSSTGVDPSTGQPCPPPARDDPACVTTYSEGVDVGYRYFAATGERPRYPFGYGRSYTTFRYRRLTARPAAGGVRVRFVVRNTGRVAGDAVPQLYLGPPSRAPAGVQFAPTALAGFRRVHLAAGARRTVTVTIRARAFQYWGSAGWRRTTGARTLWLSRDAADPVLATTVR